MLPKYNQPQFLKMHRSTRTNIVIYCAIAFTLFLFLFVYTPLPAHIDRHRDYVVQQVTDAAVDHLPKGMANGTPIQTLESTTAKHAFVTFLAGSSKSDDNTTDDSQDGYFVGARILTYQLLHAEDTRSRTNIPLVILVTPNVSERKRARMQQDGAIVVPVTTPVGSNVHPAIEGWKDVMAKLHLWELTQFELIAFLDADTILTRPIDGVFDDPAAAIQTPLARPEKVKADEAPLPSTYLFAGVPELHKKHAAPPHLAPDSKDYPNYYYLNAGFFVTRPSVQVYDYYLSLVNLTDRYNPDLPEQNLLNYAHRRAEDGGNIPWRPLAAEWNVHYPSAEDAHAGVASLHEKWWVPVPGLAEFFVSLRWKMEGFWEGRQGR